VSCLRNKASVLCSKLLQICCEREHASAGMATFTAYVCKYAVIKIMTCGRCEQVVINALTGVNIAGAAIALPLSVTVYTAHGGLRAMYLASYWHVLFMYVVVLVFCFSVYTGDNDLGSLGKVYENLQAMAVKKPVEGNADGSYLTLWSAKGVMFGVINVVGNFGTVFVNQVRLRACMHAPIGIAKFCPARNLPSFYLCSGI
jgi:Na+/proline symporter